MVDWIATYVYILYAMCFSVLSFFLTSHAHCVVCIALFSLSCNLWCLSNDVHCTSLQNKFCFVLFK